MKIVIASEHAGFNLKEEIKKYLTEKGFNVTDLGTNSDKPTDYPFIAADLAEKVAKGAFKRGILICGTGAGMAIAAGKVPGIRAALCNDLFIAKMTREHNDANVLCLGSWITGSKLSFAIVDMFLRSRFRGGRHLNRINLIKELEKRYGLIKTKE